MNIIKTNTVDTKLLDKFLINKSNITIYEYFNKIKEIIAKVEIKDVKNLLEFSLLDEYYYFILKTKEEIELILINNKLIEIYEKLEIHLHFLLEFYKNCYSNNLYITNQNKKKKYDLFIVLGNKNESICKKRVDGLINKLEKIDEKPIILFSGKNECNIMKNYFLKKYGNYENDIILENYSLDTVGNAIFSRLEVIKYQIENNKKLKNLNIGLFSSSYHSIRSFHLFQKVFTNNDNITSFFINVDEVINTSILNNELKNDFISGNEIFSFNENFIFNNFQKISIIEIDNGNIETFLLNLLVHHGLYKGKLHYYNIFKKYLD